jgi:hypothetical protein
VGCSLYSQIKRGYIKQHRTRRIVRNGSGFVGKFNRNVTVSKIIIEEKDIIFGRLGKMNLQKLLPPVWFLLSIIVMIALHFWLPVKQLLLPPVTYLGIIAIAIGIVTISFCSYLFRQKNTTIKPFLESSYLIREGFFNYSCQCSDE